MTYVNKGTGTDRQSVVLCMARSVFIGTSGWNYDGWKGSLYPEGIRAKDLLPAYAETFRTVEINNTFYSLPSEKTVRTWYEASPKNFIFAVKVSRFITHNKKLKDPAESVRKFFSVISGLDDKLGPLLFQLPPRWRVNPQRLKELLQVLSRDYRYTFEFREPSWLCDEVYDILARYDANLCFYDFKQFRPPEILTTDFAYVRLHGPLKEAYGGSYSGASLASYARKIKEWKVKKVYCYFDNDQKAQAPKDALRLIEKLK